MSLPPRTRLGPYEAAGALGAGGMGEVYRARDLKLNRDVALKVLPDSVAADPDRLARFRREAQVLASLNHPNIGHIYGFEDSGTTHALVLELIEGPTLAERIAQGPIPLAEALPIARQIAEALEAAHEQGIIHRDLKPANVKVRPDGTVKVLDFGLAKAVDPARGSADGLMDSPTLSDHATRAGVVLGTAAYMSPEQAAGKPVDRRADLWAFGVVFLEMLTGRAVFPGDSVARVLAAVLTTEPDWTALPADVPTPLRRLLRRCLEKDRSRRLDSAAAARFEIEDSASGVPFSVKDAPARSGARTTWRALPWAAAAVLGLGLGVVLIVWPPWRGAPAHDGRATRLSVVAPDEHRIDRTPPAVSPDGTQIVFVASTPDGKSQLWVRPLDSATAQPLAGTENANYPFWSPDNSAIGFFAGGKLKTTKIAGGPTTTLADAPSGRGGTWNPDGVIVFAPSIYEGLYRVPAFGGAVQRATVSEAGAPGQKFPWFLPDGRHFLFLFGAGGRDQQAIHIGSVDAPGDVRTVLTDVDGNAIYSQGHLLFVRGTTLVARPFDETHLAVTGEDVAVADHLVPTSVAQSWVFSGSPAGSLAYAAGELPARVLTWRDRAGRNVGTSGEPADLAEPRLSPDRQTAAVSVRDLAAGNSDIWLYDLMRGVRTRFTSGPEPHNTPIWSRDGRVLVFNSNRTGRFDLYRKPADSSSNEERLYGDNLLKGPGSFSPGDAYLVYTANDPKTRFDIWILPAPLGPPGVSKPYRFLGTEFGELDPQFSPDGRWIAYQSDESGRAEVYVAGFPGPGGKQRVSAAGGVQPRWRPDGAEIFYRAPDNRLMAARVDGNGTVFRVHHVEALFGPIPPGFDVSKDGRRFLMSVPVADEPNLTLTIALNWTAGMRGRK